MRKKACVILPTYNEARNIPIIVPWIFKQSKKIETHEIHVLVVDDNSPDGTQAVVQASMGEFPNLHLTGGEKQGLGEACKRGIEHALRTLEPDLIIQMDADLQHSPSLLPLFIALANFGFTLVIGSRFAPGGSTPNFSWWRRVQSLLGNWLIRFIGGIPRIRDCTSGYRCMKAELIQRCDLSSLSTRGYSFYSSFLFELLRNGARVIEVPITFPDRAYGQSKLAIRDRIEFILNIFKIRFKHSEEFTRFCLVGATGILVNMGAYILITRFLGIRLELASPVAIEISLLWNYFWNRHWTIKRKDGSVSSPQSLPSFHLRSSAAATCNYLVLLALTHAMGLWDIAANFTGIFCGILVNHFMSSLRIWGKTAPQDIRQHFETDD